MLFAKQKIKFNGKNFLINKIIILKIRVRQGMGIGGCSPPLEKYFGKKS
jgi:hypothetical protein